MSPKLDRFAGPSAPPGGSARQPPAPEGPVGKCPQCGAPVVKPGQCNVCAGLPSDATLVLSSKAVTPSPRSSSSPGAAQPPRRLGWLAVVNSLDRRRKGTVIPLEGPIAVVSRPRTNDDIPLDGHAIIFEDRFISLAHLRLARVDAGYQLEIGPKVQNPAYVNKEEVRAGARVLLRDGDRIDVGATRLEFRTLLLT
jgi:hypothetical protein